MLPRTTLLVSSSRIVCRPIMMTIASKRTYTMTPSVPQPGGESNPTIKKDDNDIHALYNKDEVSMLEIDHHDSTQHRSLSNGANQSGEPIDSFSPTFNTVFDE